MNYPDSVRYLYALGNELKIGAKWGLDRMLALMTRLGNPERHGRLVHVAGTNGKGSTSALIAAVLQASGYRTGLFTSPHLVSPTERIQINGTPLSESEFADAFQHVHQAAEELIRQGELDGHPSYFETVTAMAFWAFARRHCEWSVVEVGLGGRLDATNVITPVLSVITPISFDHESFLGNTLEAIASEKAGIIKPEVPVVTAPQLPAAFAVIEERSRQLNAPLHRAESVGLTDQTFSRDGFSFTAGEQPYTVQLAGRHQLENARTALCACRLLGLSAANTRSGFSSAHWPGRLERIGCRPDIILDGAHNPSGAAALAAHIREFYKNQPIWMVYGTMRDKAIEEVIETLFPLADRLILTAPQVPRALRPEALAELSGRQATVAPTLADALDIARSAPPQAAVFITGSLFLVGEAKALTIGSC